MHKTTIKLFLLFQIYFLGQSNDYSSKFTAIVLSFEKVSLAFTKFCFIYTIKFYFICTIVFIDLLHIEIIRRRIKGCKILQM